MNDEQQDERINKLTARVEQLTGAVDVSNQMNQQLIALLKKALFYMFLIIVFLIGAIVYGAIGKEGFYAVRPTFPTTAYIPHGGIIPWSDDGGIAHFLSSHGAKAA